MGIFSSKKPQPYLTYLIIDIATDAVRASFMRVRQDVRSRPEVLSYAETKLEIEEERSDVDALGDYMLRALTHTLSMLSHKGMFVPDSVHCFLHAPWVGSQTRIAKMQKDKPFVLSEQIAGDILLRERESFLRSAGEEITVIEEQIMSLKHNGYEIHNPFGKSTTSIEASIFFAFSEKHILGTIREKIAQVVHERPVVFHSAHFSSFVTVRDLKNEDDAFLLLSIGGLVSHVSLVTNGHLERSATFPYGVDALSREFAQTIGRSKNEIASLVSVYAAGRAHASLETLIKHGAKRAHLAWNEHFANSLTHLSEKATLPKSLYILPQTKHESHLAQLLFGNESKTYAHSPHDFNAILIDTKHVSPFVRWSSSDPHDLYTMLHSIFISRRLS